MLTDQRYGLVSAGEELPNPSTVVRYVGLGQMETDGDQNVLGPAPAAFEGRAIDTYLSVTWCEYFIGNPDAQLRCAIEAIRRSMNVKTKACFCVARTDQLFEAGRGFGRAARAVFHPEENNRAHSGIYDLAPHDLEAITPEENKLLGVLAREAWSRFFTRETANTLPQSECAKSPDVA